MALEHYFWNQLSDAWTDPDYRKVESLQNRQYWNDFLKRGNLFDTISLSREQLSVVQQRDKYLLVSGSAGSGKSITLLGRMFKAMVEESRPQRLLYVTYGTTLIEDARKRCKQSQLYRELYEKHSVHLMTFHQTVRKILRDANLVRIPVLRTTTTSTAREEGNVYRRSEAYLSKYMNSKAYQSLPRSRQLYKTHMKGFIRDEILWMKGNGFIEEEKYIACERIGRGNSPRLTLEQRKTVFEVFQGYERFRNEQWPGDYDPEDYALLLLQHIGRIPEELKYDHIYVDEMQDLQPMQLLTLSMLFKKSITITGDNKQRIYRRSPYSLKSLGIEVEGRRSKKLRVNFRSTEQNMKLARSLQFIDTENDREDDIRFVREGPKPEIRLYVDMHRQCNYLVNEIHKQRKDSPLASVAVIHRFDDDIWKINNSTLRLNLAKEFSLIGVDSYGKKFDYGQVKPPIFFTDPYSIKGLEFDYVYVVHFDRNHYPHQSKILEIDKRHGGVNSSSGYEQDLDSVLNEEKKLLYVALSRARQKTVLLCVGDRPSLLSPFIRDFQSRDYDNIGFNKTMFSK